MMNSNALTIADEVEAMQAEADAIAAEVAQAQADAERIAREVEVAYRWEWRDRACCLTQWDRGKCEHTDWT